MASLAQYAGPIRKLLTEQGQIVDISEHEKECFPDSPDLWVNIYGWVDYYAMKHIHPYGEDSTPCGIVIPDGVELTEIQYSEFVGTFTDNAIEVGVNAYGGEEGADSEIRCECGELRGLTLRHNGSLGDFLRYILGAGPNEGFSI